jgi:hypothetical protein
MQFLFTARGPAEREPEEITPLYKNKQKESLKQNHCDEQIENTKVGVQCESQDDEQKRQRERKELR